MLRWLAPDPELRARLGSLPQPEVHFEYLGRVAGVLGPESPLLRLAPEHPGEARAPQGIVQELLYVSAIAVDQQLTVRFSYSERAHREQTIDRLADAYVDALSRLVRAAG
jgi:non-ribosomal peptide synthase protein (TIGR01720 family)